MKTSKKKRGINALTPNINSKKVRIIRSAILLGFEDLKVRYSRTKIGYAWAIAPVMIYTLSITAIFSNTTLANQDKSFFYIYFGISAWNLLATFCIEGLNVFTSNRTYILNSNLPLHFYIVRQVSRNLINYLLVITPGILLFMFSGDLRMNSFFLFLISIIMVGLIGYALIWIFGFIGTLLPDLSNLVAPAIQVLFITTPVFWDKSILKDQSYLYLCNPFYWATELLRSPFVGEKPSPSTLFVFAMLLVLLYISIIVFSRRVVYLIPLRA